MKQLNDELDRINELISENTDLAAQALDDFKAKHQPFAQNLVAAKVDLLMLVIASVRNTYDKQRIDDKKLVAYFEEEKKYDEAAQVLLSKARHFFMNGNVAEGENSLIYVRDRMLNKISARVELVYLTRLAFLHGRRQQFDGQMKVSLQGLDMLNAMRDKTAWHYNLFTIFSTNIANGYLSISDFDKAWVYLQQSLEIAENQVISVYNKYNVYGYFSYYYEGKKDWLTAAAWQEKIINMLTGDVSHGYYRCQSILTANIQYSNHYRLIPATNKKERRDLIRKQEQYIKEASGFTKADMSNGQYLRLLYVIARVEHQKHNYKKAAEYLNKCLPGFLKMQHRVSVTECYALLHEVYYAWGKETGEAKILLKAYEFKQQESEMVEANSLQTHREKMEAVQAKHDLQQSELSGKLLLKQVEAMNQEIKLTALNLQEKLSLLDGLKEFTLSLEKKGYGQRKFIQAISQKISAVKITEHDKALLQQKIDEGNQDLFKTLGDNYPALSLHEVRTCGLLKTGMTDKELSKLYGLSARGYEQLRYRIKKKMKLGPDDNLVKHLIGLSAKTGL